MVVDHESEWEMNTEREDLEMYYLNNPEQMQAIEQVSGNEVGVYRMQFTSCIHINILLSLRRFKSFLQAYKIIYCIHRFVIKQFRRMYVLKRLISL